MLVQSLSIRTAILGTVLLVGAVAAFLVFGRYTEYRTLQGRLVSTPAVITVRAPQYGTIVERPVAEGDRVERGDPLLVLSSDRVSSDIGETQRRVADALRKRLASLESQIARLGALEDAERTSLEARSLALRSEGRRLDGMIETRQQRVELAGQALERQRVMRAAGYIAEEQLSLKREALLEQRSQLDALLLERNRLDADGAELLNRKTSLPLKHQSDLAELERAIAATDQELAENEARRRIVVPATASGTVTAVMAGLGQYVDTSSALLSIVPDGARLRAELYAPSRAIGMVRSGDRLLLRYAAHPYQRYGHHGATIADVTRAVLPVGVPAPAGRDPVEPVYRITAELDSQALPAFDEPRALRSGMLVEADVFGESRRLYQWVLDPLSSLRKRTNRH